MCCAVSVSDKAWFVTLWCRSHEPFNVLMDRVKYHDLYLSAGCCSCAVNVILKPLYPLFEDLQYIGPHVSLPALKLHYQQPSRLSITHTIFLFSFSFSCIYQGATVYAMDTI